MILARIIYHEEDGAWWAESPQFPSFFAAGDSFEDTKDRVREALPLEADNASYVGLFHILAHDNAALGTEFARSGLGHVGGLLPA
jgi:hypothetical protein